MPRYAGDTSFTTCPSISSVPDVIFSSPAIIRSNVALPQPEGSTKTISPPFLYIQTNALQNFDRSSIGFAKVLKFQISHGAFLPDFLCAQDAKPRLKRRKIRWYRVDFERCIANHLPIAIWKNKRFGLAMQVERTKDLFPHRPGRRRHPHPAQ